VNRKTPRDLHQRVGPKFHIPDSVCVSVIVAGTNCSVWLASASIKYVPGSFRAHYSGSYLLRSL
jgi:hypothetical protein